MKKTTLCLCLMAIVASCVRAQENKGAEAVTESPTVSQWEREAIEKQITMCLHFTSMILGDDCQIDIDLNGLSLSPDEKLNFIYCFMPECTENLQKSRDLTLTGRKTAVSSQPQYEISGTGTDLYANAIIPIAVRKIESISKTKSDGMVRSYNFIYSFSPCYQSLKKYGVKGPYKGGVECLVSDLARTLTVRQYHFEDQGVREFTKSK